MQQLNPSDSSYVSVVWQTFLHSKLLQSPHSRSHRPL